MKPKILPLAKIGQLIDRIDRAGVGSPGVGDDEERPLAISAVFGDGTAQRFDRQPKIFVRRQRANLFAREAQNPQRLLDRIVGLVRKVNGGVVAPIVESGSPGRSQSRQVGHRTARNEKPSGSLRQSAHLAQPVDCDQFDLRRPRTFEPVAGEGVESGGERVGHDADEITGTRNEREESRMLDVADVRPDDAPQLIEQSVNRRRLFGERFAQLGFEFDARRNAHHRLACEGFEMFDDLINDAIAEAAHLFACEF
jgi:hypothetical protein